MNKYIKGIVVFKNKENKSLIEFNKGINIITGESKTGKSALIDIIDYCLCSNHNTVPKGVIKDYADLYVLIISIGEKNLLIARRQSDDKMSILFKENNLIINEIKYEDFESFSNCKDVQKIIEENLGLNVTNLNTSPFVKQKGKASIRNMISYNFQHQNNIASKFSLFYRFDDSEKREQVIDQFPIFAGIVNQEYYSSLIELKEAEQTLKGLIKRKEIEENSYIRIYNELIPLLEQYYSLIGQQIPEAIYKTDYEGLVKFSKELPTVDFYFINTDITDKYTNLKNDAENLSSDIAKIKIKINSLNNSNSDVSNYLNSIGTAICIGKELKNDNSSYLCPICNNPVKEIENDYNQLNISTEYLIEEEIFAKNSHKHFIEERRKLSKLLEEKNKELKRLLKEIKYIEEHYLNNSELKDNYEKTINAKLRIEYSLEILLDKSYSNYDKEIEEHEIKIATLNDKINKFNLDKEMLLVSKEIDDNMNRLSATLDFEEEFKPTNLHFDTNTFNLYHIKNGEKISLGEMGSGANWLSCHIALFLSLLRVFTKRHEKSPMLLFIFLDQPSQVYFPDTNSIKDQKDIIAISTIFKTIFDEIQSISEDTGILPQLIITEHVIGNSLQEINEEYESKTIKHWSESTGKFIND